jgi:uncharacterized coiled-coil protein SlyX
MKTLLCLLTTTLVVLLFSACNVNPERSDAFIKLSKHVDDLEKSLKGAQTELSDLYEQLSEVRKAMETSQTVGIGTPSGDSPALTSALQRLEQIESKMTLLESQLALQQKSAATPKAPAVKPAEKETTPEPAADPDLQPPTATTPSVVPKAAPAAGKAETSKTDSRKSAEKTLPRPPRRRVPITPFNPATRSKPSPVATG